MSTTTVYLVTQQARAAESRPAAAPQPLKIVKRDSLRGVTFGLSRFSSAIAFLLANGGSFECKSIKHGLLFSTYAKVRIVGPEGAVENLLASASC